MPLTGKIKQLTDLLFPGSSFQPIFDSSNKFIE